MDDGNGGEGEYRSIQMNVDMPGGVGEVGFDVEREREEEEGRGVAV